MLNPYMASSVILTLSYLIFKRIMMPYALAWLLSRQVTRLLNKRLPNLPIVINLKMTN